MGDRADIQITVREKDKEIVEAIIQRTLGSFDVVEGTQENLEHSLNTYSVWEVNYACDINNYCELLSLKIPIHICYSAGGNYDSGSIIGELTEELKYIIREIDHLDVICIDYDSLQSLISKSENLVELQTHILKKRNESNPINWMLQNKLNIK